MILFSGDSCLMRKSSSKYVNCCLKISCSVIMGTIASNQFEYISHTSMFNCKLVHFSFMFC